MWIALFTQHRHSPLVKRGMVGAWRSFRGAGAWVAAAALTGFYCGMTLLAMGRRDGTRPTTGFELFDSFLAASPDLLLRSFLLLGIPAFILLGFLAGAWRIRRDYRAGILDELRITPLSNAELLAGYVLPALSQIGALALAILPAVLLWGSDPRETSSLISANSLHSDLERIWFSHPMFLLVIDVVASILGVLLGIQNALKYPRTSQLLGAGMIPSVLGVPLMYYSLVLALRIVVAWIIHIITFPVLFLLAILDMGSSSLLYQVISLSIILLSLVLPAILLTIYPLYDLNDNFRWYLTEERDPREKNARRRLSSRTEPRKWTAAPRLAVDIETRSGAPHTSTAPTYDPLGTAKPRRLGTRAIQRETPRSELAPYQGGGFRYDSSQSPPGGGAPGARSDAPSYSTSHGVSIPPSRPRPE